MCFMCFNRVGTRVLLSKPQDEHIRIAVHASHTLTRENIIGLAARSSYSALVVHEFWLHGIAIRDQADNVFPYSLGLPLWIPKLMKQSNALHLDTIISGIGIASTIIRVHPLRSMGLRFATPPKTAFVTHFVSNCIDYAACGRDCVCEDPARGEEES